MRCLLFLTLIISSLNAFLDFPILYRKHGNNSNSTSPKPHSGDSNPSYDIYIFAVELPGVVC